MFCLNVDIEGVSRTSRSHVSFKNIVSFKAVSDRRDSETRADVKDTLTDVAKVTDCTSTVMRAIHSIRYKAQQIIQNYLKKSFKVNDYSKFLQPRMI